MRAVVKVMLKGKAAKKMLSIKDNTLEFAFVIEEIQTFIEPVFDAIVNEKEWQNIWKSNAKKWSNLKEVASDLNMSNSDVIRYALTNNLRDVSALKRKRMTIEEREMIISNYHKLEKKYKLTEESIIYFARTLYRIEALKDFANVKKGDKGGYVESDKNLSQEGDCWISGNAKVYGNAEVYNNAQVSDSAEVYGNAKVYCNAQVYGKALVYDYVEVYGNAEVYDNALVFGNTKVSDSAKVFGNAEVFGYAEICSDAEIKNSSDYIVFKNWWSSGRYFTWTRSNNMWKVGCFYGTGEKLIKKAYKYCQCIFQR